jgi:ribosomal protein S18 acetylase RimI-like enzyme
MKSLSINVMPKNKTAKVLYEKVGFQKVKINKGKWEKMEKLIA